ncbi:hypothetical protein NLG97_g7019 [Lecanicillium saksenae]|uniref:Uncharacterized protein n=1 Tax=Lecanicillium saksenae TaxID=468837 RepID=A0ACC1QP61_9HYPO|nr:hypothetical protein NLG97_g7019 [Lecanicillium saksenae]
MKLEHILCLATVAGHAAGDTCPAARPNIIFIFTDDQDLHLGSLSHMSAVQASLVAKGASFSNHYATISQCCPSRASLFRGQHGHNTNITHVGPPGGNYAKWLVSRENNDYLPMWLSKAGYQTEYIGKFLNGYNSALYKQPPKGWDNADILVRHARLSLFTTPV